MTQVLRLEHGADRERIIGEAGRVLAHGGLCAFPTETVYGLAANRDNAAAVARLSGVKRREPGKHYTLMLADKQDLPRNVAKIPLAARKVVMRFWPGPLTIVFGDEGEEGIGIRVPASATAREIIRKAGVPALVTSANVSGQAPPTDAAMVLAALDGQIDLLVDEGETRLKEPSTVVMFRSGRWEVLREGLISHDMIAKQTLVMILFVCTGNSCRSPLAEVICRKLIAEKLECSMDELEGYGYTVLSAGTEAMPGMHASEEARITARDYGCSLADHTTRPLTDKLARDADRIYAMTMSHLRAIEKILPEAGAKVSMLADNDIPDPIGGGVEDFRKCAEKIEAALKNVLDKVL